jgi:hypothetical protein
MHVELYGAVWSVVAVPKPNPNPIPDPNPAVAEVFCFNLEDHQLDAGIDATCVSSAELQFLVSHPAILSEISFSA